MNKLLLATNVCERHKERVVRLGVADKGRAPGRKRGTDRGTNVEQNVVEQYGKPWITKQLND
jgi:hypothetical protein